MKLQDYIHYYIGQKAQAAPYGGQPSRTEEGILCGIHRNLVDIKFEKWQAIATLSSDSVKPILRKVEDITEDEFITAVQIFDPGQAAEAIKSHYPDFQEAGMDGIHVDEGQFPGVMHIVHYFIKQGVDLFGLIDAGIAVDAKTLK